MTPQKKKTNLTDILKSIVPILISGGVGAGAGYGGAEIKIAVLQEKVYQLTEEKEILFKSKASQKDLDHLLSEQLKEADRIVKIKEDIAGIKAKIEIYH